MARILNRLTAVTVKQCPAGKFADGGGLWLVKADRDSGSWVFRSAVHGRRREMGLGSIAIVGLKEAREAAERARAVIRAGGDPIKERERAKRESARSLHLLGDVAKDAFEARKGELKGDGVNGRWFSPLELHVLPKLGKVPVADIDQIDIRDTLAPIWHRKAVTAKKAIERLGIVLRHAAALGLDVDLQATAKARALLGKARHTVEAIPAMPWQDVPQFYASIANGTITHLALRFLILTGVRSRPVRFARVDQIIGETWTIPAEMIKGRDGRTSDFRVPLSPEALAVVEQAKRLARGGYLFPGVKKGVISDATMALHMETAKLDARPHGFRSSLRTWLAEATDAPETVAETILGHVGGTKVERAYRRTDFLEQRKVLMCRWADHVTGKSGQVVRLLQATGTE